MRRTLAQTAATLMTAAALMTGGTLLAAAPAQAESRSQLQAQAPSAGVWVNYKNYATHEACRQQGREMLGAGVVIDFTCGWNSPSWLLRVRIE